MTAGDYAFVADLLRDRGGIALEPGKEYLVESRLTSLVRRHGFASLDEFLNRLRQAGTTGLADDVVEAMVTTETSFFRDVHPFETLRTTVIPELIRARRSEKRLDIWCAAASSGQEPYTVAILLREYFPEVSKWAITIRATDISEDMLRRCRAGKYSQIEVNRGLPVALLMKYFRQEGAFWLIRDDLKAMIDFQQLNLVGVWPPMPAFDLVFLRNVMIYFAVETKKPILRKVGQVLRPDGYLLLGGAETTFNLDDSYRRVESLKSGFYQKIGA
ncbi:MAG TPA: protein-glutamate O-methyltransferase CheR [Fimbriiglobus sp.]|jgi:chemotaxis protein methyltransferase CheR